MTTKGHKNSFGDNGKCLEIRLGDGCKTLKIDPKNSLQLKLYPTKVIQNSKNHVTIYMYLNFVLSPLFYN